jgi:hypothetical protein
MEQVFTALTLEEANRKADDWWMKQKDVRQIRRSQTSGGWGHRLRSKSPNGR